MKAAREADGSEIDVATHREISGFEITTCTIKDGLRG